MKTKISAALLFALLLTVTTVFADSPPTNTIPILSMKTGQGATCEDITMDVLLMLLDHNFDGIWVEGAIGSGENAEAAADYCDSTKAIMVLAPGLLQKINNAPLIRWGRYTAHAITADSAFIHPDPDDYKSIDDCANADSILGLITARAADLSDDVADHPSIWYYNIFNEGPARQLKNMLNDTSSVDDYFPSMFTQDTMMTTVCTSSIFAWEKWLSDLQYTGTDGPTVSVCHSMLHSLGDDEWAGFPGMNLGNDTVQANSVNAPGRDDWIDADTFHVFTMAARCNLASRVTVHWIDSADDTSYAVLTDTLTGTAVDFGPFDLAEINPLFWTGDIKQLWLEFTAYSGNVNNNVRVGWITLTE